MAALLLCAGTEAPPSEAQFAGLFVQGCMASAGNPAKLRGWARDRTLPQLPDARARPFLLRAPGVAFDGSVPGTKLVLVSSDDGICAVVTNAMKKDPARAALEEAMRYAGAKFRLAIDRDDTAEKALHFFEYLATRGNRSWRIQLAAVNNDEGGQAMLTAAPSE